MPETLTKYASYLADFQALERSLASSEPGWLRQLRRQALARFTELGFPIARRGNEKWKYTSVVPLAKAVFSHPMDASPNGVKAAAIQQLAPWDQGWATLVFLNGRFSQAMSMLPPATAGIRVTSLAEALLTDEEEVQRHLARYATFEDDAFTALNTAFLRDGAFVNVTATDSEQPPLHLLFVTTEGAQPTVSYPRTLVLTGPNTRLKVVESNVGLGQGVYLANAVTEIAVGQGSRVEHYTLLRESPNSFHLGTTRVHVGQNASFSTTSFATGAALARKDLSIVLGGQRSSCAMYGLHMTGGAEHIDNYINIDHAQPHTTSDQYVKGILTGESRAVYTARVLIRKGAVKSSAKQADKNLILSERAEVDTKPSMEIYCDDVKATHGATAGQIAEAEDALFYMRSRGIDPKTASALLIRGFASEIINGIALEPFRAYLEGLIAALLPDFPFVERAHDRA